MNFFKKFFITLLLLTSLNLTQNFAMDDGNGLHFGGGSSSSSNLVPESPEKRIILNCNDGQIDFPTHLVCQSICLSTLLNSESCFSESQQNQIIVNLDSIFNASLVTILNLIELIEHAYQIAQSQQEVDLISINKLLSLQIQQFTPNQIIDLINITDFLNLPLIFNACAHAIVSNDNITKLIDSKNIRNFYFFKSKMDDFFDIYMNKVLRDFYFFKANIYSSFYFSMKRILYNKNNNLFDNIIFGFIPFEQINKLLNINPKNLNFYAIYEACYRIDNFCNLLILKANANFPLSNFLDQINPQFKSNLQNCLCDKIENILITTRINDYFYLSPDLYLKLTSEKFLYLLLVLSENKIITNFLDKLYLLITDNRLENYELFLAQALLCITNHREKNNILSNFGINSDELTTAIRTDYICFPRTRTHFSLCNKKLGENYSKFLFYIAFAQILKVTSLDLSFNRLTTLPVEINNLTNLKSLYLSSDPGFMDNSTVQEIVEKLKTKGCLIMGI